MGVREGVRCGREGGLAGGRGGGEEVGKCRDVDLESEIFFTCQKKS